MLISESIPEFASSDDPADPQHEALFRHLRDLYLECGWDINAVEQTRFWHAEFLEQRGVYLGGLLGV